MRKAQTTSCISSHYKNKQKRKQNAETNSLWTFDLNVIQITENVMLLRCYTCLQFACFRCSPFSVCDCCYLCIVSTNCSRWFMIFVLSWRSLSSFPIALELITVDVIQFYILSFLIHHLVNNQCPLILKIFSNLVQIWCNIWY